MSLPSYCTDCYILTCCIVIVCINNKMIDYETLAVCCIYAGPICSTVPYVTPVLHDNKKVLN